MLQPQPTISVVIPCFNEQDVLEELFHRLRVAAENWNAPYEVILIDDGSRDGTWRRIGELHGRDDRWKGLQFSRNFGHQKAVSAGLSCAAGQAVVVMDADLQDAPEDVRRFIDCWREGYEVVYAVRQKRKEGPFKRLAYFLFYRLLHRVAETPIPLDSGDFCLMDRRVVDTLRSMPEQNRFVRGLRAWVGFRQIGLPCERQRRAGGAPQYTLSKLVRLATDGLFSFSTVPLRLVTKLGLIVSTLSFLGAIFTLVQRLFADWFASFGWGPVPGFATIVIGIFFLGGVQLICLGIIGEYVGRIYDEVKRRPLWIVQATLGLDADRGAPAVLTGLDRVRERAE